jgi:hypothetical protein
MRKTLLVISILIISFILSGCGIKGPRLTSLQRRGMESKELEGTFDDAFKATLLVLQDKGYAVKTSDFNAGLVFAETNKINLGFWRTYWMYQMQLTANIEKFTDNRVKMRILINRNVTTASGVPVNDDHFPETTEGPVDDPQIYRDLYAEIQREMFLRARTNR